MKQVVPTKKNQFSFFGTGLRLPPWTTLKAVLMAVDITKAPQTKCKICFGGPRMILNGLWKRLFPKKQSSYFTTLADPTPPIPGYGKRSYFFSFFTQHPTLSVKAFLLLTFLTVNQFFSQFQTFHLLSTYEHVMFLPEYYRYSFHLFLISSLILKVHLVICSCCGSRAGNWDGFFGNKSFGKETRGKNHVYIHVLWEIRIWNIDYMF